MIIVFVVIAVIVVAGAPCPPPPKKITSNLLSFPTGGRGDQTSKSTLASVPGRSNKLAELEKPNMGETGVEVQRDSGQNRTVAEMVGVVL